MKYSGYMASAFTITSTGTGADAADITLTGSGSDSGVSDNRGIWLQDAGTSIGAVDGDIALIGTGGDGSGNHNYGIYLFNGAVVDSTGAGASAGNITLTGTGGDGTDTNIGIRVNGVGVEISAVNGDITLTGAGGNGSSNNNYGIRLEDQAIIASAGAGAGAGNIALAGTGGAGTGNDHGIILDSDAEITAAGPGTIMLTGATSATGTDIVTANGANVIGGAAAGDVTLIGNTMDFANLTASSAEDILLRPRTANTTIGLNGAAGTLNLTTAELDMFDAGDDVIIGRADGTGAITVDAYANWATIAGAGIQFLSDTGVLSINGAQTIGARDLTIITNANPVIAAGVTGTGTLTLETTTAGTTLGLAGGAGTVNYAAAELNNLGTGWTLWNIGSTAQTGALTMNAYAWTDPVTFLSAAAGNIVVSGAQTAGAASNATFTFSGPTTLGANVSTAAATGGTQDITFSDDVTLTANAQVLAGNGDLLFSGTVDGAFDLTLSAAGTMTLSDDIGAGTPLDDLTLTADADPIIGGTVEGTGILTLQQASNATTMGVAGGAGALNYALADLAGLGANWTSVRLGSPTATGALTVGTRAWDIPVDYRAAAAGSIVISGAQTAGVASDTIFTFSGPATINASLDLSNATGGTQAITFDDAATVNADITSGGGDIAFNDTLSLGADLVTGGGDITLADTVTLTGVSSIDTTAADIVFGSTLDGTFDLELTTTGDITFGDDVGAGARLGDVVVDPRHLTAGTFNAASFTLANGTGNVSFAGTGLNTTGDIGIDTNGNVTGTYQGVNGIFDAGAGTITATVSFTGLDIAGTGATLSAGYIGAPGAADQAMANLISIEGQRNPWPMGIPSSAYTFAGLEIGSAVPIVGGGGGGGSGGGSVTPPVIPPIPSTNPGPVTPPRAPNPADGR
jgi:hypothetical protein